MKKPIKPTLQRLCVPIGICLLVVAIAVLCIWQWNITVSRQRTADYINTIRTITPTPQGAVPEARRDNAMPTLVLDGVGFIGIIEMPRYGSALPVRGDWGKISKSPCLFSGSVYDGTLQIGATTQKGQYDFYREISVGDTLYFTDMEGNRFTYQVTDLRYEKHADRKTLQKKDASLTLFIKNVYAFEYLIVYCNVQQ